MDAHFGSAKIRSNNIERVAVLMGTLNGKEYINEQLESIVGQSYRIDTLLISDDGSTDGTLGLVCKFKQRYPHLDLRIMRGPRKGFAANYMKLLH